jgi:hypothetical protein
MVARMRIVRSLVLMLTLVGAGACSTAIALTDRGTAVTEVGSTGMPDGCSLVGDVSIGIPPDAARPATEAELVILMRNKAGQMGGTHVLVESRVRRDDGGGRAHYLGRGRAYRCDPSLAPRQPAEPPATDVETPPAQ